MRSGSARPGILHILSSGGPSRARPAAAWSAGLEAEGRHPDAPRGRRPPVPSPPPWAAADCPGRASPQCARSSSVHSRFVQPQPELTGNAAGGASREWLRGRWGREFSSAPIPFVGLVSGCEEGAGVGEGLTDDEPSDGVGRAWKTCCHAACRATAPHVASSSVVNPREERVVSCGLHCPKIQLYGLGLVHFHFIQEGEIAAA